MNDDAPQRLPIFAVCDRRESDGKLRIVAEFRDPDEALSAATLMRWAGDPVEIVLVSAIRGEAAKVARSAANWFLDAATFAKDADPVQAKQAALAGIKALDAPH